VTTLTNVLNNKPIINNLERETETRLVKTTD